MTKKRNCASCNFCRQPGAMAPASVTGTWCSNSKSYNYRKAVASETFCSAYWRAGKKAPIGLRLRVKAQGAILGRMKNGGVE